MGIHFAGRIPLSCERAAPSAAGDRGQPRKLPEGLAQLRVQGSGLFRVEGLGFRVRGSGFRVSGLGFRVQGLLSPAQF